MGMYGYDFPLWLFGQADSDSWQQALFALRSSGSKPPRKSQARGLSLAEKQWKKQDISSRQIIVGETCMSALSG